MGAGSARAASNVEIERAQKSPSRAVDERNIPTDPPKFEGGDSIEIAEAAPDEPEGV